MLIKDLTLIHLATKDTRLVMGQTVTSYIDLRTVKANVQYMSNEEEQRVYGVITNSIIIIRASNPIQVKIGDGIYLSEPIEKNGDYGTPDYNVESIKTAYIGVVTVRNPILITARRSNK